VKHENISVFHIKWNIGFQRQKNQLQMTKISLYNWFLFNNLISLSESKHYYFFFFTALAFGKSVIEPSKISAAKPIDSFNVG